MIGEIERFATHLKRFVLRNRKVSRQGQVQLKDSRAFQVVEAKVPVGPEIRIGKCTGIQPVVDTLVGRIRIRIL